MLFSSPAGMSAWEGARLHQLNAMSTASVLCVCIMLFHDGYEVNKHCWNFLNHADSCKDSDKTRVDFKRNAFRPQVRVTRGPVTELEQKVSDFCYSLNKKNPSSLYELKILSFHSFFFFLKNFPEVFRTVYLLSKLTWVVCILAHRKENFLASSDRPYNLQL